MRTTDSPLARWMPPAHLALDRERWLAAFLLLGVATLFALYVIVLERGVQHAQLVRAQAHARAVAEADCAIQRPGEGRAAHRKIRQPAGKLDGPPDFPAPPRNLRRAVGKFGEALYFPAGRPNFRQAVEKSGSVPENSTAARFSGVSS